MAVDNFKKTVWSILVHEEYSKQLVFAPLTNRDHEGEIQGSGDKVKINEVGDVSVRTYAGTVTYDDLTDASKFLLIDQQTYAAINIDDIDELQSNVALMGKTAEKIGKALSEDTDEFLATMAEEAGIFTDLGTESVPIAINSANIVTYLSLVAQKMDEANNPQAGRVAIVPPWMAQKLTLAKITKDTNNSEVLTNGYVGTMMGFDIYMSNSISHSGTTWYKPMFFLRNDTIAFAEQLNKLEALRAEASFSNRMRGLMVYGAKVTRPNSLAVLTCAYAAEA